MATRNNDLIRRDINRLNDLIALKSEEVPALEAIAENVSEAAAKVNAAWQSFQALALQGDKERDERDSEIGKLVNWIHLWRPVVLIKIPGAEANLKNLPSSGATPDDAIRVAEDMLVLINGNPAAAKFREKAGAALTGLLESAKKENKEAVEILPKEIFGGTHFTETCVEANSVLIRGLSIVRSAFGPTSREYKQFIARSSDKDDEEEAENDSEAPVAGAGV